MPNLRNKTNMKRINLPIKHLISPSLDEPQIRYLTNLEKHKKKHSIVIRELEKLLKEKKWFDSYGNNPNIHMTYQNPDKERLKYAIMYKLGYLFEE